MRERRSVQWIAYGFIAIFIAAILSILVNHMVEVIRSLEKDKIGDAATWAGAFFAGLAFGGTIWIANSDRRARDRERLMRAHIAAPAMVMQIEGLCPRIAISIRALTENLHGFRLTFGFVASQLNLDDLWDTEDVLPFIGLPSQCARKLVVARESLILVHTILSDPAAVSSANAQKAIASLSETLRDINIARDVLIDINI